tara:strand:+ start:1065 stop:1256 length:192 start_codon:yes stop_codon:yes gene_type:complete
MYYLAKVKIATDTGKGVKWIREVYLVEGVSVTDAEAIINKEFEGDTTEFEVTEVKKSDVVKVL